MHLKPKKWLIGNWKMNGNRQSNSELLHAIQHNNLKCQVAVCPPTLYLDQANIILAGTDITLGLQDIASADSGAYTGQVSVAMALECGAHLALVGHSERRHGLGETNTVVAAKAIACLNHKLIAVLCVGETLAEREAGKETDIVSAQLKEVLAVVKANPALAQYFIVAYEPVWAIGTGKTASPAQAQAMHAFIRGELTAAAVPQVSILYGGSVKPSNAAELFNEADIDGGLIGGASLIAADFLAIGKALT